MLQEGKLNLLLDGQFGSTGKGLFAGYIGYRSHIDIAISNAGPNAGHTFYPNDASSPIIVKHLPISGIINDRSTIYLCCGSVINPELLLQEIEESGVSPDRVFIHPRASVISSEDILEERRGVVKRIASTMNGVGSALVRKIGRHAVLAEGCQSLKRFVRYMDIQQLLVDGCTAFMEVPQGMDLSLNHGLAYPYCTSRDVTPSNALNDAGVHPKFLGSISVTMRTFPIRVGNLIEGGEEVGWSGPFYEDSKEISWEAIGVSPEYTTRTNRIRRVATFSHTQYRKMLSVMLPDHILLNFCNYLSKDNLATLLNSLPEVTHLGFGPRTADVQCRLL